MDGTLSIEEHATIAHCMQVTQINLLTLNRGYVEI